MKISKVLKQLEKLQKKHGDVEVMFSDPNSDSVYSVESVGFRVAEEDEFDEDWNMPEGYKFVDLSNF